MAIGSAITSVLNTQNKVAATSWSPVTTAIIPVGNFAFIAVASDNVQTTNGTSNLVQSVTVGGQAFDFIAEYTNGPGAVAGGATISVWGRRITTQIASGATVAISFAPALPTAKGVVGGYFAFDTSKQVGIVTPAYNTGTGAPGFITTGAAPSDVMWLGLCAIEAASAAILTASSGTLLTQSASFTTGGSAATNMSAGGLYSRSATGSETSLVRATGATGDNASIKLGIYEAQLLLVASTSFTFGSAAKLSETSRLAAATSFSFGSNAVLKETSQLAAAGSFSFGSVAKVTNTKKIATAASFSFGSSRLIELQPLNDNSGFDSAAGYTLGGSAVISGGKLTVPYVGPPGNDIFIWPSGQTNMAGRRFRLKVVVDDAGYGFPIRMGYAGNLGAYGAYNLVNGLNVFEFDALINNEIWIGAYFPDPVAATVIIDSLQLYEIGPYGPELVTDADQPLLSNWTVNLGTLELDGDRLKIIGDASGYGAISRAANGIPTETGKTYRAAGHIESTYYNYALWQMNVGLGIFTTSGASAPGGGLLKYVANVVAGGTGSNWYLNNSNTSAWPPAGTVAYFSKFSVREVYEGWPGPARLGSLKGLQAATAFSFGSAAKLVETSGLKAAGAFSFGSSATLVPSLTLEPLAAAASIAFGSASVLTRARKLVATTAISFGSAVVATKRSGLKAVGAFSFTGTGTITQPIFTEALVTSASMAFGSVTVLTRQRKLVSAASFSFGSASKLTETSYLAGSGVFSFGASAVLGRRRGASAVSTQVYGSAAALGRLRGVSGASLAQFSGSVTVSRARGVKSSSDMALDSTATPSRLRGLGAPELIMLDGFAALSVERTIPVITPIERISVLSGSKATARQVVLTGSRLSNRELGFTGSRASARQASLEGSKVQDREVELHGPKLSDRVQQLTGSKIAGRTLQL